MKAKELAEELEVDERQIRKYRQDLEMAGIYIQSIKGVGGGYILKDFDYLLNLDVKEEEMTALNLANIQLKDSEFIYWKEFNYFNEKIAALKKNTINEENSIGFFMKTICDTDKEKVRNISLQINYAILAKRKIRIKYFSPNSGDSNRIVQPYAIVNYKNSLYLIAYCELRKEIRDFKISRVKNYEILQEKFVYNENFSLKEYMKYNLGMYRDGIYNVKLLINAPMSYIISEKSWVKEQKISWNDDESIIFQGKMRGKTEIISWILSMGDKVKVLEPKEIYDEIRKTIDNIKNIYC